MDTPLVSVIIPVYNADAYLCECLDSLVRQTYQQWEIIAVNDGSTDGCLDILDDYASRDFRIRVFHRINSGVSATRNFALEQAKGDYVMFVDADDWLDDDTLEICVKRILEENADVCLFSYRREFKDSSLDRFFFEKDRVFDDAECRSLQRRMLGPLGKELSRPETLDSFGTIWGKLYKRLIVESIAFEDLSVIGTAEDSLFNCRAFLHVKKAVYLHRAFYHYRKYNTGSETKRYKADLPVLWENLYASMSETALTDDARRALQNRIALGMMGLGLNEYSSACSVLEKKKRLVRILKMNRYKKAYAQLDFSYFPFYWKIFYYFAKHRMGWGLLLLLYCMNRIINR